MSWPVALLLAVCSLLALAYLGAIAGLLGLKIQEAIGRLVRWRVS